MKTLRLFFPNIFVSTTFLAQGINNSAKLVIAIIFIAGSLQAQSSAKYPFEVKVTGKGQPVILIPGALCSGEVWDETVAKFKDSYQCHVITLSGYAGTTPLHDGPYMTTYKEGIKNYIKENRLKKVILVGHSLGGFLGQWVASEMGNEIEKLVVVDALPFLAAASNPAAKEGFSEEMAKMYYNNIINTDKDLMKQGRLNVLKSMITDSSYQQKALNWSAKADPKTEAWTVMEMMGTDLRDDISNIKCPVMVMVAYAGPMPQYPNFTREGQIEVYSDQYKNVKNLKVVSPQVSKHFIMYDQPEWFYTQLEQFLAGNTKQAKLSE